MGRWRIDVVGAGVAVSVFALGCGTSEPASQESTQTRGETESSSDSSSSSGDATTGTSSEGTSSTGTDETDATGQPSPDIGCGPCTCWPYSTTHCFEDDGLKCTMDPDPADAGSEGFCAPIPDSPAQLGDPCQPAGTLYGPAHEYDDCDAGLWCAGTQDDDVGRCVAFCAGEMAPFACDAQTDVCVAFPGADDQLHVCLLDCQVDADACPIATTCTMVDGATVCLPD